MNTEKELEIVAANVFTSNGGDLVEAVEGRVRTTTLDVID